MPSMHWANAYIGDPYSDTGEPPGYNCWSLVRHVQRAHYGRNVPLIAPQSLEVRELARLFDRHPELQHWQRLPDGATVPDGAVCLMSHNRAPHHCGLWLDVDGGRVLHAERGAGVTAPDLATLRATGWRVVGWFVPC